MPSDAVTPARSPGGRIPVLHLACELGLGGTERALQHLVEALDPTLFDVTAAGFSAFGARGEQLRAGGHRALSFEGDADGLVDFIRREAIALVHVHLPGRPGGAPSAILAALERAAPPVVVETNVFGICDARSSPDVLSLRLMPSKTALLRFGALAPTIGPDFLERRQVLYNPLDIARLERLRVELEPQRERIRARLGIAPQDFVVGRIGRPDDAKWSSLLPAAFARLVRTHPTARLLLQSAAPRGRRELEQAGLAERCLFLEPTGDEHVLAESYVALDVVAATSRIGESFGYLIAEGMCFRRPVVANQTPRKDNAQVELIDAGRTGYVAFTARGLALAFERLADDPAQRKAFGEAGAAKAAQRYDVLAIARDLERRYGRLLAGRGVALPAALRARLDDSGSASPSPSPSPSPSLDELRAYPAEYCRRTRAVLGGIPARSLVHLVRARWRARSIERRLRPR